MTEYSTRPLRNKYLQLGYCQVLWIRLESHLDVWFENIICQEEEQPT